MAVQLADAQAVEAAIVALQVKIAQHSVALGMLRDMAVQSANTNAPISGAELSSIASRLTATAVMTTDLAAALVLAGVVTASV